jgi:hypothetical protein
MPKTTINGKSLDVAATGPAATIQKAGQAARLKGYVTATNNAATMFQARAVLSSQNVTISNEPANFSLIAEEKSDKPVSASELKKLTPEPISATDKFPEKDPSKSTSTTTIDGFYDPDDPPTDKELHMHRAAKPRPDQQISYFLASFIARDVPARASPGKKATNKYTTAEPTRKRSQNVAL